MIAIPGTTIQISNYFMPVKKRQTIRPQLEHRRYELSDAVGDLNSAEFNLGQGDHFTAHKRLQSVTDYLLIEGVIGRDIKDNTIPEGLKPIFLRYESLMHNYISLANKRN